MIATSFAISALRHWLWTHAPRRILEVGAGIGSLSWVLADYLTYLCGYAEAVSVEDDPWCRAEWEGKGHECKTPRIVEAPSPVISGSEATN